MSFLVDYGESSDSEGEEGGKQLTDPGKSRDIRNILSVLPAPRKGKKEPVRIGFPSRGALGSDSEDSEEEAPSTKRKKVPGGGLTALLPQPKNVPCSRLVSKTVASTPQSMVPYTLTSRAKTVAAARARKRPPSKVVTKATKAGGGEGSDSDDGEPVSFFSHLEGGSDRSEPSPASESHPVSAPPNVGPGLETPYPVSPPPNPPLSEVQAAPVAPRPFYQGGDPYYTTFDPSMGEWNLTEDTTTDTPPTQSRDEKAGPMLGAGPGLSMDEEAYRRFMGGNRNRRGRDHTLNDLIEIKEDDVKDESNTYRRHFSEETIDNLYKPSGGEKPSAQQKRKHQLTYLAHQAKANELQLLKQWGQSAATRKGTQMKYGF